MVDLSGDQYRAAVLQAPGTSPHEYLVWAANSSQLALADDPTWWMAQGTGRIPVGTMSVSNLVPPSEPYTDGTLRVIVTDDGGREIGAITHVVVARGDKTYSDDGWVDIEDPSQGREGSAPYEVVVPAFADQNGQAGLVTLTDNNVFTATGSGLVAGTLDSVLGGGLSIQRGDTVIGVRYTVAPLKFWWTRNDRYETRFGWDGKLQRWRPYKGSAPVNLGQLLFDTTYKLVPKMRTLPLGAVLAGDAASSDEYAQVRLGTSPGALSLPVGANDPSGFEGILVVTDDQASSSFEFSGTNWAGVVGQDSAVLVFNPRYVEEHAGKTLWYVYSSFDEEADGLVGPLLGADTTPLYLAPIPGGTDHPILRIANRSPLTVTVVDTEADLEAAEEPAEGACLVAQSTGRVRLSQADIHKADPKQLAVFNKHFLGAKVVYEGVALNAIPQPTRAPIPLVQEDGVTEDLAEVAPMYVRSASLWPEDIEGTDLEPYMGLGVSGVLQVPDGTGAVPTPEGVHPAVVDVPVRPGGDSFPSPPSLGLVRAIQDTVGDTILFSQSGAISEIVITDRLSDMPEFPFQVPGGKAYIAKEATTLGTGAKGSRVQLGTADRVAFAGKKVYFLQATLTPATYTTRARLYSKNRIIFRFDGDEVLYFSIDGTAHDWHASSLPAQDFYTPEEVAASIQARITAQFGNGVAEAIGDRVVLASANLNSGVVEIGWGTVKDLSGCAALGFLPGWRVKGGKPNWLPDAGISVGFARNLLNLDRSKADADYKARVRLEEATLSESIAPTPFAFLDFVPVEDVAGFDEGVFFNLQTLTLVGDDLRIQDRRLEHFEDIQHRFAEGKLAWLEQDVSSNQVQQKTATLALGHAGVVPETMLGAPGIGGGLLTAESGGSYTVQEQGVDYLLPEDGQSGVALLVTRYGARVLFGAQGAFTQGSSTFTDPNANFLADSTDPDIDPDTGNQRVVDGQLVWLPVVQPGFRLKIATGDAAGSYIVTEVTDATHFEVTPPFVASSVRATPWEVFHGIADSLYDPAIVADVVYEPFNHLPEEPFKIRVLSPLGRIEGTSFEAFVEDATTQGRPVNLRFGAVTPGTGLEATLTPLALTPLGVLANNQLALPWTTHVAEGAFKLQIGAWPFHAEPVASFSADPIQIEYLTDAWDDGTTIHPKGELKFPSSVLSAMESSGVVLVETLRDAASLAAGQAEYDTKTGEIVISASDAATYSGTMLYFVEQMITTGDSRDVAVSPTVGAVSFVKPLSAGAIVEMTYWLADSEGRRVGGPSDTITEFLPIFVRREEAVRLTNRTFQLDPNGLQVWKTDIEPLVYVGPTQQNFGKADFTVDRPDFLKGTRLTFDRDLPAWVTPVATYAVYNAQGGERSYTTSQKPVYRPPFFIPAGKDNFGLRGDRTGDFVPGQMLRIGAECFYITQVRHFSPTDVTRIDIYPSTVLEVGSRSPGNDVLALVTSIPISSPMFPDGPTPQVTTAKLGFMQSIPTDLFPFEPVNARQASMTFMGDLTTFVVPGHIMEISGMPFTVASATLNADGTRTKVTFTSAFQMAVDPRGNPTIKLSYRPIYPPEVREFLGKGPLVASEGVELTLFGEMVAGVEQPGRQLVPGTEYNLDTDTGTVQLLAPLQAPLGPGQRLLMSFTQMRTLAPFFSNGSVVCPRWAASYRYNTIPTNDNGFLGGRLTATYTFDNPDTFYFRALPLRSYLPEALKQAVGEMRQWQSASGPRFTVSAGDENWDHGNLGLFAQQRDLLDKDRAARAFLGFYNEAVLAFEQVEETITGEFIGDRDGKFRFWVGPGQEYAPPGYEDEITGALNPTNVWVQVFASVNPALDITFLPGIDWLVDPNNCTLSDLVLSGYPLDTSYLERLLQQQSTQVRNDVDDIVLLGGSGAKLIPTTTPPYFTFQMGGTYTRMGLPHRFSRLYPTTADVFFTLQPGIGADPAAGDAGVYAYSRVNPNTGEAESTNNKPVGQVANPVLGAISNISSSILRQRHARSRIWGYFPNGLAADAFGTPINKPCMILSAVPLAQVAIDPATGYPDPTKFLSQAPTGTVPDAVAGDPAMALPGFQSGDRIAFGKPDGRLLGAVYPEEVSIFGLKLFTPVFVDEILFGCVVTFKNLAGDAITSPSKLLVASTSNAGTPADEFGIGQADTLYVVPPDVEAPITDPTESPTMEMQQQAALASPAYRQGFDLTVQTSGRVLDLSLPSWDDPSLFPLKEMLGQKSPKPLGHLEGTAEFANLDQVPLNIPALLGDSRDDAGDYQIPYLKGTATELDRFDEIGNLLGGLMARDAVLGGYYPDEILFVDGEVVNTAVFLGLGLYKEPATLMTQADVMPAPTFGTTPGRAGDFVLVEMNPASPQGWQGFLSVGAIRSQGGWSWIEPPRFVTQTNQGSAILYSLQNYAVHTTPGNYPVNPQVTNPDGVRLYEDTNLGSEKVVISFNDVNLILNNGDVVATGNLNSIWAADPNNVVRVKILSRPDDTAVNSPAGLNTYTAVEKDGRVIATIHITSATVWVTDYLGGFYGPFAHGGVVSGTYDALSGEPVPGSVVANRHIVIDAPVGGPVFPFTPTVGARSAWFLPNSLALGVTRGLYGWEFALDVDCSAGQSVTAYVGEDRLTFHEVVDLEALSRPRGFAHPLPPNYVYETGVRVNQVMLGTGALSPINDVIGAYLTFVSRTGSSDFAGGTWTSKNPAPIEDGSLRVMAFEDGNTPLDPGGLADIVAAVQASQTEDPSGGPILVGDGTAENNHISAITPSGGDLDLVQKGDVVYIDRSATGLPDAATMKAGTYVVRHAVKPDPALVYKAVEVSALAGVGGGFIVTKFPRCVALDVPGQRLEVDDISMLPAAGRVFVLLNRADLSSPDPAVFQRALFSVDYFGFLGGPNPKLVLVPGTYLWADNTPVAPGDEPVDQVPGVLASWVSVAGNMTLNVKVRGGQLPDDSSVVGYHNAPGVAAFGFHALTMKNYGDTTIAPPDVVAGVPAAGQVGVVQAALFPIGTFDPTNNEVIYREVPDILVLALDDAQAGALNDPQGHLGGGPGVTCLLPGTEVATRDGAGAPSFFALGGVFIEPSVPQQSMPLSVNPKVVDATRSLPDAEVGMKIPLTAEDVHFEVRRVRRWHGKQNALNDAFFPLRYAYEIRRGVVTGFSRSAQQVGTVTAALGTSLGGFNDEDVNIHPGDIFRVLDATGALLDEGVISEVVSATQVKISAPSFKTLTAGDVQGKSFEVYLRQAPVPHEQSNEQLLALITDRVVLETQADRTDPDPQNWTGGYVPETDGTEAWLDVVNKLYDDTPGINFTTQGVKKGDIVIIDPAGAFPSPIVEERGFRPLGDRSVPTRTANGGPSPYLPGGASNLDDNRGFYRVKVVHDDYLELDPVHTFAGTLGADVLMGGTRTNLVYAVYPTVNVSVLSTDGAEGQNDLRPTRKAVGTTYTSIDPVEDAHSIRPFSYRVLRPSSMFSTKLVDTVLAMRERMLSLIEMLGTVTDGSRGGFYWDWQNEVHVEDLGTPTDPESGAGLFPNRLVVGLVGETSISPYCNNSTCLSLLDRRFWIHDIRLDSRAPDPNNPYGMVAPALPFDQVGGPYTAYTDTSLGGSEVRPVLTDHLDLILDVRDRLRAIRYTWLAYRTHRFRGSLAQIDQFAAELPGRLADQQRILLLEATVSKVTT